MSNHFSKVTSRSMVALVLALSGLVGASPCLGQKPAAKAPAVQPTDELGDALLRDIPAASIKAAAASPSQVPPKSPPKKLAGEGPGGEDVSREGENISQALAERMQQVGKRLQEHDLSPGITSAQQDILAELDRQLLAAKDTKGSQKSGSSKPATGNSGKVPPRGAAGDPAGQVPAKGSSPKQGTSAENPTLTADLPPLSLPETMRRSWGHLPAKVREQMQSSLSEKFLPKYEKLTEEYYRRLAAEPAGR